MPCTSLNDKAVNSVEFPRKLAIVVIVDNNIKVTQERGLPDFRCANPPIRAGLHKCLHIGTACNIVSLVPSSVLLGLKLFNHSFLIRKLQPAVQLFVTTMGLLNRFTISFHLGAFHFISPQLA